MYRDLRKEKNFKYNRIDYTHILTEKGWVEYEYWYRLDDCVCTISQVADGVFAVRYPNEENLRYQVLKGKIK